MAKTRKTTTITGGTKVKKTYKPTSTGYKTKETTTKSDGSKMVRKVKTTSRGTTKTRTRRTGGK